MVTDMMKQTRGVTLLEVLLALAIVSSAFGLYVQYTLRRSENVRINITLSEIQGIQNAALAYYIENNKWPGTQCTLTTLNTATMSSSGTFIGPYLSKIGLSVTKAKFTPWGTDAGQTGYYKYYFCSTTSSIPGGATNTEVEGLVPKNAFIVVTEIGSSTERQAIGKQLAGRLPSAAFVSPNLFSWVLIPPQSLSKVQGVKFAGLYHHGACVPQPVCPTNQTSGIETVAQIFLIPTSVSGTNDNSPSTNVYPISSFTAYASGSASATPTGCEGGGTFPTCSGGNSTGKYWRVCAQVITERGDIKTTRTDSDAANYWGQDVTMAAFTRCAPENEAAGSPLTVFGD